MSLLEGIPKDDSAPPGPPPPPAVKPAPGTFGVRLELKGADTTSLTAGTSQDFEVVIWNTGREDDMIRVRADLLYGTQETELPEWGVKIHGVEDKPWDVTFTKIYEKEIRLIGGGSRELTVVVTCPRGARFGDKVNIEIAATSLGDPDLADKKVITATARPAVVAVKTSIGHERTVADSLAARAKERDVGIFSILAPATIRGYVFVESMNPDRLDEVVRGIRRARGVAKGETSLTEIEHFLTPKPIVSGMMEGDIVELVAGPFKGEKARVQRIDEAKEEITVELFEAMVPIPITVRGDHVRVIEKEEK
ncbi:MAG TPA: transcription elongation factor Spt5 [Thermoplasmata archaeon]|jgi:transcriptional antiterminator NusG|nr:transcription elongation factor Spt5 [Thermoplasmata archaeon]